jgi:hypothetical protein
LSTVVVLTEKNPVRKILTTAIVVASQVVLYMVPMAGVSFGSELGSGLRIERTQPGEALFKGLPPGYAERWWARFRNRSFCPFVICHGSCAIGEGPLAVRTGDSYLPVETPCPLPARNLFVGDPGSCCRSTSANCCR